MAESLCNYEVVRKGGVPVDKDAVFIILRVDNDTKMMKKVLDLAHDFSQERPLLAGDIRYLCGKCFPAQSMIASGYEWICPMCETENKEIEAVTTSTCCTCGLMVPLEIPEHAFP